MDTSKKGVSFVSVIDEDGGEPDEMKSKDVRVLLRWGVAMSVLLTRQKPRLKTYVKVSFQVAKVLHLPVPSDFPAYVPPVL
jgi:hypothetical protein